MKRHFERASCHRVSVLALAVLCLVLGIAIESLASGRSFLGEETALDTFTVKLLVESNGGNPPNVVLYMGAQPGGSDGRDDSLDQFCPPLCPSCNFEAYFPFNNPNLPKLKRDIRSSDSLRHVWTIITSGKTGMLTWYPHTFPRYGTFLFENVTDMRKTTTATFAVRDTMVIVYNMPGVLPDIEIAAGAHDFGSVLLGSEQVWSFPIRNTGAGDLVLKNATSDRVEFRVISPVVPCGVAPSDSVDVILSFAPQNLGSVAGQVKFDSSDPDEPNIYVAVGGTGVTPEIEISSFSHDFGALEVGESSRWTFDITNAGTGDLMVSQIVSSTPRFSATPGTFSLSPGVSREITVAFSPTVPGFVSGVLSISTNDQDEPLDTVSVSGTGIAAEIELSASQHDFGVVPVGHSARWTLEVTNRGAAELCIDTTTAVPAVFTVSPVNFCVVPDSIRKMTVVFLPSTTGAVSGQVSIVSNDPDEPLKYVAVSGEGAEIIEPDIHIEEKGHDFGTAAVGTSSLWNFDVVNFGSGELIVDEITVMHPHFVVEPAFFSVSPFSIRNVQVSFVPAAVETVLTLLIVRSNDWDEPACSLSVNGIGIKGAGIEDDLNHGVPAGFYLFQNSPNPFNPSTTIMYHIPNTTSQAHIALNIFDILGRRVKTLVDEIQNTGMYSVTWDGRDAANREVSSGIYWCQLQGEGFTGSRKMILLK